MLKSEARKLFLEKRKSSTPQQRMLWEDLILIQFQQLSLSGIDTLFTYAAMDLEVNTDPIVDYMQFGNPALQIAYPVCDFLNFTMDAHEATLDTSFTKNKYGTLEPENTAIIPSALIDMIIIPLLCFDEDGYRVGYGKGFYDKYLAKTPINIIKVGLSFYEPIDKILDRHKFDVPLNYCVTPERTYEF